MEPGQGLTKAKFELLNTDKGQGHAKWHLDTHAMAYILRGLNCLIGKYEMMIANGETLDNDDVKSFAFIKDLRDGIQEGRDKTLPDGPPGPNEPGPDIINEEEHPTPQEKPDEQKPPVVGHHEPRVPGPGA